MIGVVRASPAAPAIRERVPLTPDGWAHVPDELRSQRRWVTWRYVQRRSRVTKQPDQRTNDPSVWLTFREAIAHARKIGAGGIGFVLGEGIAGIDLDDCIDDGTLRDDARDALALGSYAERSPSGRGLHVLIRGTIARNRKIRAREIYDGRSGSARYLTITGDRIGDATAIASGPQAQAVLDTFVTRWFPDDVDRSRDVAQQDTACAPLDDKGILAFLFASKNGAKARALFGGDWSGSYPTQSEADFALLRLFRFYTRDPAQLDRLFRGSGLMRDKWDEQRGTETYGAHTIAKALALGGRTYRSYVQPASSADDAERAAREDKAFAIVPRWWIKTLAGHPSAMRVLVVIATYANKGGEAWPAIATLAADLGISKARVKAAIAIVEAAGIMTHKRRGPTSSLYQLLY